MTTESPLQPPRPVAVPLLRPALASAVVCLVIVGAGAVVDGAPAASGAGVGAALVLGVFGLGAVAVDLVSAVLPSAALLIALLTYTLQVLAMALAFVVLTRSGLLDEQLSREWLAGAVVAGTVAWLVAHLHGALTARIPAFEAPRAHSPAEASADTPRDGSEAGAR
ncbi:MAG: hypothetical protein KKE65_06900 [Actinobacteria bacterium]|jgi:ATP synthase protein I|uniref:ATP synthase protein I n=1 Tax=Nocardioides marinus TaxID=374514 RepID=A0A7Y9YCE7_9ACTN|nr:hypothetical protein [Nocardioides marinus]MBU2074412.1 hypothetical protein [Actinomycetota bacterium]MBU2111370.1 hypothetical protein [Actinomycetota bacterium]NYI09616.1 ATP synthase protein I [Nocardioides marinus]